MRVCTFVCTHLVDPCGGQKRVLEPLEMVLQAVVSHWCWGLNSGSFKEWKVLLTTEPSHQPLIICSFKNSVVTAFKGQLLHNRNMINGKHLLFRRWDLSYYNYNWCISGCNYITGKFTSEAL